MRFYSVRRILCLLIVEDDSPINDLKISEAAKTFVEKVGEVIGEDKMVSSLYAVAPFAELISLSEKTGLNYKNQVDEKFNADMEVFGMLSKKISTMFGPIGNLSLNTLFNAIPGVDLSKNTEILDKINKIPGIELSGKAYRRFIAEIKGNINGEDYVTSFKWIN